LKTDAKFHNLAALMNWGKGTRALWKLTSSQEMAPEIPQSNPTTMARKQPVQKDQVVEAAFWLTEPKFMDVLFIKVTSDPSSMR